MINKKSLKNLRPAKKGEIRNPAGRPKGKTIKERVREWLEEHPEDMQAFVEHFVKENRDLAWQMLEGRPPLDIRADVKTEEQLSEEQLNELLKRREKKSTPIRKISSS
jgi:hypothetical protein